MAIPVKTLADTMVIARHETLADTDPHVSAEANGGFLVGFTRPSGVDDTNVYRIIGSESSAGQSNYTFGLSPDVEQSNFSSGTLGTGGFAVTYASKPDSSGDSDIYGAVFNPLAGSASHFLVNVGNEAGNQIRPEVCETAYGGLVFVWIDDTAGAVKAAGFMANGTSEFTNLTASTTAASQFHGLYDLGLTALSNGAVAVSWRDDAEASHFRVVGGGFFRTDEMTLPGSGSTDLVQLADGRILVTYYAFRGVVEGHFAQIYEDDGVLSVPEFQLSVSDGFQAVTALLDGRLMVAYDMGGDIYGRIFNADGTAGSPEFRINTDTNGTQGRVHLDTLTDGQVAVAWEDGRTGGGDICYTVLDPRETGVEIAGTPYSDSFVGSAYADVFVTAAGGDNVNAGGGPDQLFGGAGSDFLYGEGGNDTLSGGGDGDWLYGGDGIDVLDGSAGADGMLGGLGNDLFYVDQAGDRTNEAAGQGTDSVYTTVSYALAAGQEIEILTTTSVAGTTALTLTGNELGQRINGNDGNNILYGGAGNDLLVGYAGNDNIEGQAGADTLKGVSGIDKFVFRQSLVTTSDADHISDFGTDDFIFFDHPSVTGPLSPLAFVAGANALDANDRFIYYAPYNALYFDPDGNGATAKILFAIFDNGYAPTAADVMLF